MPKGTLEPANVTVSDADRSSQLMQDLCGWHERWRGKSQFGGDSIHVGDETHYIAFYSSGPVTGRYSKGHPLNHLAVVVDDLDAAEKVVADAGLVLPLEPEAWADALDAVAGDADRLRAAGRRRAEQFTAVKSGEGIAAAFRRAVDAR